MNQELMLGRIAMLLSRFTESVKIMNANGEFNINVHAENALIKLLNVLFDCQLENVNYIEGKQLTCLEISRKHIKDVRDIVLEYMRDNSDHELVAYNAAYELMQRV